MSNEIERRQPTPEQQFGGMVEAIANKEVGRLFAGPDGQAAVAAVALAFRAAVQQAEKPDALMRCSPVSIASCMINSARTRLLPGGPNPPVYLVPKGGVLGWWLNHRGIVELAERAGTSLECKPVFSFDTFDYSYGLNPNLVHRPGKGTKGWDTLTHVYVIIRDGNRRYRDMLVMDRDEIEKRRKCAQFDSVWQKWPIEQAMKTAMKYSAARGMYVMGEDLRAAMEADEDSRQIIDAETRPVAAPARQIAASAATVASILDEPDEREVVPVEPPNLRAEVERRMLSWPATVERLGREGIDVSSPDLDVSAALRVVDGWAK